MPQMESEDPLADTILEGMDLATFPLFRPFNLHITVRIDLALRPHMLILIQLQRLFLCCIVGVG